ncbi:MAG: hypothetical protein A3C93_05410 [Candidatus Lloydbacteria bacterium RIFCSPHIGHO2_02_FULL_54_17]|uniref:Toxin YoeB n=1 Tax=Candidatus Lloydbacteria bacterium RIFCSPHIGHO2_02_FULL_54_17 TaxID=1798664 RepID=A0A1G2DGG6_9BACT|nr:MAG: hypothetical protein A3C93_05410 [Candidatus Lloydbacteria bacterium RIFCSPHIGHO2_02_FULL_54_17]OGZ13337.1 MAG: hypothetical protein A2948_04120 [Candidatus Lloydbacteria bacterium RIFCSPLOWO2_01_FULL_54_18]
MVEVAYHSAFTKSVRKLPRAQQRKLAELIVFLQKNPYDRRLHTTHLSTPLLGVLSFRITRDWRVLFRFIDTETVQLIDTAHRSEIYR